MSLFRFRKRILSKPQSLVVPTGLVWLHTRPFFTVWPSHYLPLDKTFAYSSLSLSLSLSLLLFFFGARKRLLFFRFSPASYLACEEPWSTRQPADPLVCPSVRKPLPLSSARPRAMAATLRYALPTLTLTALSLVAFLSRSVSLACSRCLVPRPFFAIGRVQITTKSGRLDRRIPFFFFLLLLFLSFAMIAPAFFLFFSFPSDK